MRPGKFPGAEASVLWGSSAPAMQQQNEFTRQKLSEPGQIGTLDLCYGRQPRLLASPPAPLPSMEAVG